VDSYKEFFSWLLQLLSEKLPSFKNSLDGITNFSII
jgi:hypothetical protein